MISHAFHRRFDAPVDTGVRSFGQPYLLYASDGVFHLETDDRLWLLPPHRAALVAPGRLLRVHTLAPATSSSVLFAPGDAGALGAVLAAAPCSVFAMTALLREMVVHAGRWDAATAPDSPAAQPFFAALAHVVGEAVRRPEPLWLPRPACPRLRRALDYTLAHLGEALRFAEVARQAGVSARTLNRRFAEELGMPWTEFLQHARVVRAAEQLLATRRSVTEIAYALGFSTPSKFAQAFRRLHGVAPLAYRRQQV